MRMLSITYVIERPLLLYKYCISKSKRSLCAQSRLGTLPLAIERGRFTAFPEEKKDSVCYVIKVKLKTKSLLCFIARYDDSRDTPFSKMSLISNYFFLVDWL